MELFARSDEQFEVVIRGTALCSGAVPPVVRVGNHTLRNLDTKGDNVLRGVLDAGWVGDVVTVDLGPLGRSSGKIKTIQ